MIERLIERSIERLIERLKRLMIGRRRKGMKLMIVLVMMIDSFIPFLALPMRRTLRKHCGGAEDLDGFSSAQAGKGRKETRR